VTIGSAGSWTPYCGAAPSPADWLSRWNFDPWLLAGLAASAVAWRLAVRGDRRASNMTYLGVGLGLFLFVSPFCALTSALFSARVVHHVILGAVLAPLIAFSLPRDRVGNVGPLALWTGIQALIFWSWHSPRLYSAALSSDPVYWAMQLSLLGSAVGFWLALRRSSPPSAVAALLFTMVQMGLLGALITFAASPLYAPHWDSTAGWGLAPIEDQQLAGLIMWAPAAALYLAAALVIAGKWLKAESRAPA